MKIQISSIIYLTCNTEFAYFLLQIHPFKTAFTPNPYFILNTTDSRVLRSLLAVIAKSLHKSIMFDCFFGLSANLYSSFLKSG